MVGRIANPEDFYNKNYPGEWCIKGCSNSSGCPRHGQQVVFILGKFGAPANNGCIGGTQMYTRSFAVE